MKKLLSIIILFALMLGMTSSVIAALPLVFNTWVHTSTGFTPVLPTAWSFAFTPDYKSGGQGKVFVGDSLHGDYDGIYKSTDNGVTWSGTTFNYAAFSLAISPNYSFDHLMAAGTEAQGVFITTSEWAPATNISGLLPDQEILAVAFSPDYVNDHQLFTGTRNKGLYVTVNSGANWVHAGPTSALPDDSRITSIVFTPDYATSHTLFIAASADGAGLQGVYRGVWSLVASQVQWTWTPLVTGLTNFTLRNLAISPNYLNDHTLYLASYGSGLYKSPNSGASWSHINGTENLYVQALAISPDYALDGAVYFGEDGKGVYRYLDGAASSSVSPMNAGFIDLLVGGAVTSLAFAPGNPRILFAGIWESSQGGVWQYLFPLKVYLPSVQR